MYFKSSNDGTLKRDLTDEINININGVPNKRYSHGNDPLPHNGPISNAKL